MIWQQWVLVVYFVLASVLNVATVGRPRKPLEAGIAAWSVLVSAGVVAVVISI